AAAIFVKCEQHDVGGGVGGPANRSSDRLIGEVQRFGQLGRWRGNSESGSPWGVGARVVPHGTDAPRRRRERRRAGRSPCPQDGQLGGVRSGPSWCAGATARQRQPRACSPHLVDAYVEEFSAVFDRGAPVTAPSHGEIRAGGEQDALSTGLERDLARASSRVLP